jgi:hypothetical protein
VPTSDPATFVGTATILIVVALVACIVPARRAPLSAVTPGVDERIGDSVHQVGHAADLVPY